MPSLSLAPRKGMQVMVQWERPSRPNPGIMVKKGNHPKIHLFEASKLSSLYIYIYNIYIYIYYRYIYIFIYNIYIYIIIMIYIIYIYNYIYNYIYIHTWVCVYIYTRNQPIYGLGCRSKRSVLLEVIFSYMGYPES